MPLLPISIPTGLYIEQDASIASFPACSMRTYALRQSIFVASHRLATSYDMQRDGNADVGHL